MTNKPDTCCEHGTALDVHCCNCHSGFIFDKDHECPPATLEALEDSWRVEATEAMAHESLTPPQRNAVRHALVACADDLAAFRSRTASASPALREQIEALIGKIKVLVAGGARRGLPADVAVEDYCNVVLALLSAAPAQGTTKEQP